MPLRDKGREPFGFWIARDFLIPEETPDEEYTGNRTTIIVGSVVLLIIVLVGLFTRVTS